MEEMSEALAPIVNPIIEGVLSALGNRTLPAPNEVSYYVLENERKIYLDADVDEGLMDLQRMILRWNMEDLRSGVTPENAKPIWIYIMSYGGDVDYMWTIIDTIEASATPVYTVNLGVAGSAAALIFAAGKKRFMTKNAKVIIHEGSAEFKGDAIKVMDATESYAKILKAMKEYILEHSRIPRRQLMAKHANDWTLTSKQCLDYGLCERVIENLREIV